MKNKLKNNIMRRVYYAYALRLLLSKFVVSMVFLTASVYALSVMVHVASIFENFRRLPVNRIDNFVANAFLHTDPLTILCFGLVVGALFAVNLSVFTPAQRVMRFA